MVTFFINGAKSVEKITILTLSVTRIGRNETFVHISDL